MEMDHPVWIYSLIPDIQYGIYAISQVWAICVLDPRLQKPGVKTLEWYPGIQRRINMVFGKVYSIQVGLVLNTING